LHFAVTLINALIVSKMSKNFERIDAKFNVSNLYEFVRTQVPIQLAETVINITPRAIIDGIANEAADDHHCGLGLRPGNFV
jgi:hypothetical protein